MLEPSTSDPNGRDSRGRFATGNEFAVGNPHAQRIAKLRGALLEAVSEDDVRAVVATLISEAKAGSVPAAREILDRTIGKADAVDLIERVAELEKLVTSWSQVRT